MEAVAEAAAEDVAEAVAELAGKTVARAVAPFEFSAPKTAAAAAVVLGCFPLPESRDG